MITTAEFFKTLTVVQIKARLTDFGMVGISKLRKAELINALTVLMDGAHTDAEDYAWIVEFEFAQPVSVALPRVTGKPMSAVTRESNYKAMNGCDKLTARQRRRIAHKAFKAFAKNRLPIAA